MFTTAQIHIRDLKKGSDKEVPKTCDPLAPSM